MVAMGLWRRKGLFGGIGGKDHGAIEAAIAAVGLTGFEQRTIGTLSGGQMQRMLFARLLLQDARLIVLDEPFTAIDAKTSADLLDLVRRWHSEQRTVLAALHDIELVQDKLSAEPAARPRAGRLGRDARGVDGGEPQQGAPHVRGVRRASRGLRGRSGLTTRMLYNALIAPFAEFEFMRRALVGSLALALGAPPVGVFLMLRRMSLIGDAMAHAILPGAAIGFLLAGLSLFAMAGGGLIAGFLIAFGAGLIARATLLKEDASLAAFFLISLALGVTIVSVKGSNIDLLHFLFGSVLAIDDPALMLIASITSVSLVVLAVIWRPLVLECVDPGYLRSVSRAGGPAHIAFLALVVLNLVGGFQALGTLLAVGIMMLPAVVSRFWARDITTMIGVAIGCAAISGYAGLLVSYHANLPSGPAIILVAGVLYALSVRVRSGRRPHLARVAATSPRSVSGDGNNGVGHDRAATLADSKLRGGHCGVDGDAGAGAGNAGQQNQSGRDLLHPWRSGAQRRRRSCRRHDAGRTERRRSRLFADTGRRQKARGGQYRFRQRPRAGGLDDAARRRLGHQGADDRRYQGYHAAPYAG